MPLGTRLSYLFYTEVKNSNIELAYIIPVAWLCSKPLLDFGLQLSTDIGVS